MDWLTYDPITNIHGPAFLLVYAAIALAVIAAAYGIVRSRDKSSLRDPPPVPASFDPFELAYLRGGTNAVIHTAVYALHQRGLVRIISKSSGLVAVEGGTGTLTEVERRVLRALDRPVAPSSLFHGRLAADVERHCEPFRRKLESDDLLRTAVDKASATRTLLMASAGLVALTFYKVAMAEGRPVGFLILLTFLSLVVLWAVAGSLARARMTDRGKAYLKRLQVAYQRPEAHASGQSPLEHLDAPSVALVGLCGLGILSSTPDAAIAGVFASSASGGGCGGGGCGGGGGGGCGGGGCGG